MKEEEDNLFGKTIYSYTEEQAEEDGYLVNVKIFKQDWEKGIFSHITNNLLTSKGYLKEGVEPNLPNILDLLNQANNIVKIKSKNFKKFDTFFSGPIELPSGEKHKIFIQQNSTGNFTIMLPEDY